MRLSSNEVNAGLVVTERDVLPGDLLPVVLLLQWMQYSVYSFELLCMSISYVTNGTCVCVCVIACWSRCGADSPALPWILSCWRRTADTHLHNLCKAVRSCWRPGPVVPRQNPAHTQEHTRSVTLGAVSCLIYTSKRVSILACKIRRWHHRVWWRTYLKSVNVQDGDGGGVLAGVHLGVDPLC